MIFYHVADHTAAYTSGAFIAGGERWPEAWVAPAAAFRNALSAQGRAQLDQPYGPGARHRFDLFLPEGTAQGLVIFIHGGYWRSLDRGYWSHYAAGALAHGLAVAMPSYDLCPEVRITDITRQIGAAVATAADRISGPLRIVGHSAGGHLAARMVCADSPLPDPVRARIDLCLPISGLFDLRPLLRSAVNDSLRLDEAEALAESPALVRPLPGTRLMAWVGGAERQEFRRQTDLIANIWAGVGARTAAHAEADRHHFDILEGLRDPAHPMVRLIAGG